jgi:hypothetical protein
MRFLGATGDPTWIGFQSEQLVTDANLLRQATVVYVFLPS